MSLEPLLNAPWVIQVHAFAAIAAFLLGAVQLSAPKGTLPHRTLGAVWVLIMSAVVISSIFIRPSLYPELPFLKWFGPIHAFTVLTGVGIVVGVSRILKGGPNLKRHSGPFIGMFLGGLVVAGALAFLPGRIMNEVMFGG